MSAWVNGIPFDAATGLRRHVVVPRQLSASTVFIAYRVGSRTVYDVYMLSNVIRLNLLTFFVNKYTVFQKTPQFVTVQYLRQILTDCQNSFTGTVCIQFAITRLLNIPPHLNCLLFVIYVNTQKCPENVNNL